MGGDQYALAIEHRGENILTVIGERARDSVFETFPSGRLDVIAAPPQVNLFLAPSFTGIVFVEPTQISVISLVESLVPAFRQAGLPHLGKGQLKRMLRADESRGEGKVECNPVSLQSAAGLFGLLDAEGR